MKPEISLEHFWDRPLPELLHLLHLLQTTPAGLTSDEANRRLRLYGANSLVRESRFAALFSFLRLVANPVVNPYLLPAVHLWRWVTESVD